MCRYAESTKNLFDMTITFVAVLATIYVYYPNDYSDSRLIRYVIMTRVLRLLRLLFSMKPFQVIVGISMEILPLAANVLLLLFCIMYMFAALGMHLFGGMISRDPSNPLSYLVLNTDFSDNDYWANNFNDMISSLNVLFNLLVVNNWTECADGFEAVTQSKYTRLFFLAFHVFGVILVNNVVTAFIVNSFIAQWDIQHERFVAMEVEGEAMIEGRQALFDASLVTGTKTFLTGKYVARVGRLGAAQQQHDLLKHLFTKTESQMSQTDRQVETGTSIDPL
jgi:two pore calcium channel protein, plant